MSRLSLDTLAELETKICEALGLRPEDVKALTFHMEARTMPQVTVERYVGKDNGEALATVLQHYTFEVKKARKGKES